jgi:hypothetical protein
MKDLSCPQPVDLRLGKVLYLLLIYAMMASKKTDKGTILCSTLL